MDTETSITSTAEPIYTEPNVHSTTDAAARMAHDLIDRVARVARESEERLRDTATGAESSLQQTVNTARDKTAQAGDSIGEFVRQHPVAALSIAFGSGVLLSYLARSRVDHDDAE